MTRELVLAAAVVLLCGCGDREGRGGLTADEERQLDEAAKMLEDNMIDASPDSLSANEQQLEALDEPRANGTAANLQ